MVGMVEKESSARFRSLVVRQRFFMGPEITAIGVNGKTRGVEFAVGRSSWYKSPRIKAPHRPLHLCSASLSLLHRGSNKKLTK